MATALGKGPHFPDMAYVTLKPISRKDVLFSEMAKYFGKWK